MTRTTAPMRFAMGALFNTPFHTSTSRVVCAQPIVRICVTALPERSVAHEHGSCTSRAVFSLPFPKRVPTFAVPFMSSPTKAQSKANTERMEKIVSLCKRRGFVFQSSEIYGGLNGCWDYGPLGVELKRNLKDYWWRVMTRERDDVVGMDGSILMNRAVWKASGHEDTFSDPMVDCRTCKARLRADQLAEKNGKKQCTSCGGFDLTEPRAFNLMFKTYVGATE